MDNVCLRGKRSAIILSYRTFLDDKSRRRKCYQPDILHRISEAGTVTLNHSAYSFY